MNNSNDIHITSDRLILRMIQADDAAAMFQYRSNAEVNKYQGWIPKSIYEVHDFISSMVSHEMNLPDTWVQWVIIQKDTDQLIGDIGIHFLADLFQAEIGCTLDILHQGKGYATEALQETINYLFWEMNKHRITASIDPRNQASIGLMRRLGFRQEAHFRESILIDGQWVDDLVYALLKDEWSKKRKGPSLADK